MENQDKDPKQTKVTEELRQSAHQIWLAGLGAFAKAGEEGEKVFRSLVKAGEETGSKTRDEVQKQISITNTTVEQNVEKIKTAAMGTWDKMEKFVDERVSLSLKRLGIPTRDDIKTLTDRVNQLATSIEGLKKPEEPTPKTPEDDLL